MAVLEQSALMIMQDSAGNDVIIYPITTIDNVDGALTEEEIAEKISSSNAAGATNDGAGNNIIDTYATKTDTYTKQEVENIIASLQEQLNNAIVNLTVSKNVITFTRGNGETESYPVDSIYG